MYIYKITLNFVFIALQRKYKYFDNDTMAVSLCIPQQ